MSSGDANFPRRPYTGSCHCGNVKYICFLGLPLQTEDVDAERLKKSSGLRMYKCNCNTCHKMGIFHLRLKSAPDDFFLLSPLDPEALSSGLTRYMTAQQKYAPSSWWFCTTCGVRCFTIRAPGESTEAQLPVKCLVRLGVRKETGETGLEDAVNVPVWRLQKEGFGEGDSGDNYFSVNAVTLDAHQEGLDLRVWHEKRWVQYFESLADKWRWHGEPHPGGTY